MGGGDGLWVELPSLTFHVDGLLQVSVDDECANATCIARLSRNNDDYVCGHFQKERLIGRTDDDDQDDHTSQ